MKKWFGMGAKKNRKMTMQRAFGPICIVFIGTYVDFKAFSMPRRESRVILLHLRKVYVREKKIPCFSISPKSSIGKEFMDEAKAKTGKSGRPMVIVCKDVQVLNAWVNPSTWDLDTIQRFVRDKM